MEICDFCGDHLELDLLEVWGREFMFSTCCEELHEWIVIELNNGGGRDRELRDLFEAYGIPCRQISADIDHSGSFQIDHGLELAEIDLTAAKAFVTEHHAHHKPSLSWRWGHAVYNGPDLIGVCMVGRPVARMIDGATTVEVTRLCVRRDISKDMTWNACSMLYAAAAKEAKRRGFAKVITYILETEAGDTLKAVGWDRETRTKGGSWNRPGRARTDKAPICRKWRYGKMLAAA
jgi:hypothetical protein